MDISNYQVNVNQLSAFLFKVEIITPDKVKFTNEKLHFDPNGLTKQNLVNNLIMAKNNWICDIESEVIKPPDVIDIQEVKEELQVKEVKLIPEQTGIAPISVDTEPKIEDTVVYES